ncbi:hypothetical protein ACFQX4_22865 [Roseomonas sp. GCM10028921]
MTGDAGDDRIEGGGDVDLIYGGAGNGDRLSGDAGDDIYLFRQGDGSDVIEGFYTGRTTALICGTSPRSWVASTALLS